MANKSAILSVRIIGDATKAIKEMDKLGDHTSKFGSLAKTAGKAAAAGIAVAGAAMAGVAVAGVKAAADLEQSTGAIDTVFGDAAKSMHKHAKAASTALGLTENSYNELATLLGTQLKNAMGGANADMSKVGNKTNELIGLGADLASMFGGTTADAVGALSSALKGERDPIERYGVSLKQAQIDAKAAEMGFEKVGGSLSNEANAAATLALIMEQTGSAHGNFAKETDTLSHQIEVAKAQIGNIVATIGQAFLPGLTKLGKGITKNVLPAIQQLTEKYAPVLGKFFEQIGGLAEPLLEAFSKLVSSGLTPMGAGIQAVQDNSAPLMELLKALGDLLTDSVFPALEQLGKAIIPPVLEMVKQITPPLVEIVNAILKLVGALLDSLMPPLTDLISTVLPIVTQLISSIMPILADIVKAVTPIVEILIKVIGIILQQLTPVLKEVSKIIVGVIQVVGGVLDGFFKLVTGLITGDWKTAWEGAKKIFITIWNAIKGIFASIWNGIKQSLRDGLNNIKNTWVGAWNNLRNAFSNTWNSIKSGLNTAWQAIGTGIRNGVTALLNTVKQLPGRTASALRNMGQALFNAGRQLIAGFINGIKSMFGGIGVAAKNIGTRAINGVKGVLGIKSPSKVFTTIGIMTGKGMVNGVEQMRGQVQNALQDMVNPRNLKALKTTIKPPAINTTVALTGVPFNTQKSQPNSTVNITINGAIDPDSTARQIRRVLNQYDAKVTGATIA